MTTSRPDAAPEMLSEARNVRLARSAFHFLSDKMSELKPVRVQLSIATDTYESLDDMVDLIRAKLEPGTLTLWAVDSIDEDTDGITICITGNNEKGEDHAKWIATMWANMPLVIDHLDSLLTTVRVQQEAIDDQAATIARLREALRDILPYAKSYLMTPYAADEYDRHEANVKCAAAYLQGGTVDDD